MKKILTGFLLLVLLVFTQLIYIDYTLNARLRNISNDQNTILNEVELLSIKTGKSNLKLEKIRSFNRNKDAFRKPTLALTNNSVFNFSSDCLVLAGNK